MLKFIFVIMYILQCENMTFQSSKYRAVRITYMSSENHEDHAKMSKKYI